MFVWVFTRLGKQLCITDRMPVSAFVFVSVSRVQMCSAKQRLCAQDRFKAEGKKYQF